MDASPSSDAAAPDAAITERPDASSTAFVFTSEEPATCPLSRRECADDWPSAGSVTLWRSSERFGATTHARTAWLYRPSGAAGALPLVLFLHGGNGSGAKLFARQFDELAQGQSVAWRKNTATCAYVHPAGFRDAQGNACQGAAAMYRGQEPFALLLPDGIPSISTPIPGARHWEDGRTPSPGQLRQDESRDDVGYIAHLIDHARQSGGFDMERVYIVGWSNGGMMTQRVLCAIDEPGREPLRQIAAAAVGIASLPVNLFDGSNGRPRCPRAATALPPMMFQVGRGIETPDCASYPCAAPVVDGDGIMPFGAPGGRHQINSPDLGSVVAFDDALALFDGALRSAYGPSMPPRVRALGAFSEERVVRYGDGTPELRAIITIGGAHETGGTRFDFANEPQQWAFVAGFRRSNGRVERRAQPAVSGEY